MSLRAAIVGLVVLATIGFVAGTSVERSSADTHVERATPEGGAGETGESEAARKGAGASASAGAGGSETHAEFRPLGIGVEAAAFVALAAIGSLALACGIRARSLVVLGVAAAAMAPFAVLDAGEVVHQIDEHRTGLALLAGIVAALHVAAAVGAGLLARRTAGSAGTMAA